MSGEALWPILLSVALGGPLVAAAGWFLIALFRGPKLPIASESIVASARAFLDGGSYGKNGRLVLTADRLYWFPIRFPLPRESKETRLLQHGLRVGQVDSCEVAKQTWVPYGVPLVITTADSRFVLYIGTLEIPMGSRSAPSWRDLIKERAAAQIEAHS